MTLRLRKVLLDSNDGNEADDEGLSNRTPDKRGKKGTWTKCGDKDL